METYGQIFAKICEILHYAKSQDNKVSVRGYLVCESDVQEFKELLEIERTAYLLSNNKEVTSKNKELIKLCEEKIAKNDQTAKYLALYEILQNSFGKTAIDLREHLGYYVHKDDFEQFHILCKLLHVGPSVDMHSLSSEERKNIVVESLKSKRNQFDRINNYMRTKYSQSVEKASVDIKEIDEDDDFIQIPRLDGEFNEILYLGIHGFLTIEMIADLKPSLSEEKFEALLDKLYSLSIFNYVEIAKIRRIASTSTRTITDIDELFFFFASRDELNVDGLKNLIPAIGLENYHYIIDQLFLFDMIDIEKYKENLEEFFHLSETEKR